jgi:hypothetical protein
MITTVKDITGLTITRMMDAAGNRYYKLVEEDGSMHTLRHVVGMQGEWVSMDNGSCTHHVFGDSPTDMLRHVETIFDKHEQILDAAKQVQAATNLTKEQMWVWLDGACFEVDDLGMDNDETAATILAELGY